MPDHRLVTTARCASYDPALVGEALDAVLGPLGGMSAFVKPGQRVFVKPNLLLKAEPGRAITTHPEVLRAVLLAVKACDPADVAVGDSPSGRQTAKTWQTLFDTCGLGAVCREEGARIVLLDEDVVHVENPRGERYAAFELGREAVEADVLIDLCKFKTHGFQLFTGAVKNLFGLIPGLLKAQFHVRAPEREDFGGMLVDLMLARTPELSIMDAVVGLEGEGPGTGGTPKDIGALIASADPVALDVVAASIAGFEPLDVYTNNAAHRRGLGPASADEVDVVGVPWRELAPSTFEKPARSMKLPPWAQGILKRGLVPKPVLGQADRCSSCATCRENCPVHAIEMVAPGGGGARGKRPRFDYDACIRCYCCQEMCPEHALTLREPWLLRFFSKREQGRA